MIQVRLSEEKDLDQIQNLLKEEVVQYDINFDASMVIEERGQIYGFGGYKILDYNPDETIGYIDLLVIFKNERLKYFGDSLIKSILNLMDRRHIKKVYILGNEENKKFFKKVRLIEVPSDELSQDMLTKMHFDEAKTIFCAELPAFFNTACRSKGN